ncbi:MAG TPA: PQQ-dependent dehydrogenase, methanol/ethanol family [Granulicella sp.]
MPRPARTHCTTASLFALSCLGLSLSLNAQNANLPDAMHNPFANDPNAVAAGKTLYEQTCQSCHGGEARGDRGPNLTSGNLQHGNADTDIYQTIRTGVPGTQMPAFSGLPTDNVWRIITYLRSLSTTQSASEEKVPGDPAAGEKLFGGKGRCLECHEVNGTGGVMAGDLSAIGVNSVDFLRTWVLHPGAPTPSPAPPAGAAPRPPNRGGGGGGGAPLSAATITVKTKDGKTVEGVRVADDSFTLLLRDRSGAVRRFDSGDLLDKHVDDKPLMPTDYEKVFSTTELQDLLAYLKSLKERDFTKTAQADIPGGVTQAQLNNADATPQNWLSYWGDYKGRHFTELTQITPANIKRLAPAWTVQMPGQSVLETTPVVVDGIMYTSGNPGEVYALDAKTGVQIWKYERRQKVTNPYETNPFSRGVAVLGNRVFLGTLDAALVALDARTGRVLWETQVADTMKGYTITAAPLAVKDKIIVGVAGGEFGIRGFLDAYDAKTGKRLWRFNTIPGPGEPGSETWSGDSWQHGSGGTWLTGSYDPELDTLYWTVGNPGPNLNGDLRKGDDLFTCSVLALDPETGQRKWHYQFTPNDTHDWDSNEDVVLADVTVGGQPRKVLLQANRNGMFYMLDRTNGKFISAFPYVKQTWNKGFDANGKPILADGWRANAEGVVVFPSLIGGANWQNPSFDPASATMYLIAYDGAGAYRSAPVKYEEGRQYQGGAPGGSGARPAPGVIQVMAIDAVNSKVKWTYPLIRRSFAIGVLGTRSGLVFAATGESNLIALDSKTGKPLWRFLTGGTIAAAPMSYSVDGKQYIALAAGNTLYTFALTE